MPYSSIDELPDSVKKHPENLQKQWMEVWNSAYKSCEAKNGEDCESAAFAQANGVLKKATSDNESSDFLFVDLSTGLTDGVPFEGMAPGSFRDMHGRRVEFKLEDLPLFIQNTQEAILASTSSSGDLVGLPIDARNHDKGDAAGWVTGVSLSSSGDRVLITPKWTDLGSDLIKRGIRRMFSPTVDLESKTILGGSLTNWPASRDSRGKVLLRPIELSSQLLAIADSLEQDPVGESGREGTSMTSTLETGQSTSEGVHRMGTVAEMTLEELTTALTPIIKGMIPAPATVVPPTSDVTSLASLLDLDGLSEEAKKQRKAELTAQLAAIRRQAELEYQAEMVKLSHENKMAELAQTLVGGTSKAPRGYQVSAEELIVHLTKMAPDEAKFWEGVLSKTQEDGFVEFAGIGNDAQPKGTKDLPKEIAAKLDSGEMKVTDLTNPILALGDLSEFNLARWAH